MARATPVAPVILIVIEGLLCASCGRLLFGESKVYTYTLFYTLSQNDVVLVQKIKMMFFWFKRSKRYCFDLMKIYMCKCRLVLT